ncbi:MAG TPA: hypothetical protein VFM32_00800, partial [Spongiibacteraceae bacterium]|nr:hypothetical protein [Spongiibacteraceae bacterium]
MKSIRSSLLTALFLSIIFQGAITLYKFFVDSRLGLVQFYDSELVEFSQVLPAMAAIDGIVDSDVACEDKSRVRLVYATWNNESASPTHLSCRGLAIKRPSVAGLSDQVIAGENWRIYMRILNNGVSVVAQPSRVRAKALTL